MKEDCQIKTYVGLDVSVADTHICVLNEEGTMLFEGAVASEPDVIAATIFNHAPICKRVAVETEATTSWLWRETKKRGIPVICIDARPANKALSMCMNKAARNDARGLAELMRIGWFKEANVRTLEAQEIRSMLSARYQLKLNRRDNMNQMRGIVKTFGLFTGSTATRKLPEIVREKSAMFRLQP